MFTPSVDLRRKVRMWKKRTMRTKMKLIPSMFTPSVDLRRKVKDENVEEKENKDRDEIDAQYVHTKHGSEEKDENEVKMKTKMRMRRRMI